MKNRIIALLLIILQIVIAVSSCTQSEENGVKDVEKTSQKTTVFKAKDIELSDTSIYLSNLSYADGKLSIVGNSADEYSLYSFDENGENGKKESVPFSDGRRIFSCQVLSDNMYVYSHPVIDGSGNSTDMKITFASSENEEIFSVTADSLFGAGTYMAVKNNIAGAGFSVIGASPLGDDGYILVTSLGIFTLDLSGSVKSSIFPDGSYGFYQFTMTSSGEGIVLMQDINTGGTKLGYIDTDSARVSDFTGDIAGYIASSTKLISGNGDYSFYFTGSDSLFGAVTSRNTSEAPVQIINLIESNINPSRINGIASVSDEKFIVSARNESSQAELLILTMIPKDELVEKASVVLAHASSYFRYTQELLDYNRSSDMYKIEYADYSIYNDEKNNDYISGMQILVNEIIAGDIPDIMCFNMSYTSNFYSNLMRKGLFTDLYTFFDNDPDVSRETVVPFILEPFETDGKLYRLVTYPRASMYMAERDDIPYDTWSYEKAFELMDSLDDTTVIADYLISYTQRASDRELGGYMLSEALSDFTDYENASVSFDSDAFIRILEKMKEGYDKRRKLISNGDEYGIILNEEGISNFDYYIQSQYAPWRNHYNDPIIVPQPSLDEQSLSGASATIESNMMLCITESSKNKDGAWDFFKYLISEEVQDVNAAESADIVPINRNSFEKYIDDCASLVYYYKNRSWMKAVGEISDSTYDSMGTDGVEVKITREHVETFKKIMYNAKGKPNHDYALQGILLDEILPFINSQNDKSAQETAKAIQSRASIFISESN